MTRKRLRVPVVPVLRPLNPRQLRFIDEYCVDLNGTQAVIRVGYSSVGASVTSNRLLANPRIRAEIDARQLATASKLGVSREYIIKNLLENVERAMQATPVMKFDHELKQMVETGEFQYEGAVANRALELLGKHLGMFGARVRVEDLDGMTEDELEEVARGVAPRRLKIV